MRRSSSARDSTSSSLNPPGNAEHEAEDMTGSFDLSLFSLSLWALLQMHHVKISLVYMQSRISFVFQIIQKSTCSST